MSPFLVRLAAILRLYSIIANTILQQPTFNGSGAEMEPSPFLVTQICTNPQFPFTNFHYRLRRRFRVAAFKASHGLLRGRYDAAL